MGWVEHWSSYISSLNQSTELAHYNQSLSYYSALSKSLNLESSLNNFTTQPESPVHSYALKFVMVNLAQGNSTEHALYICPSTSCNVLTLLFLYSSSTSCLLTLILLLLSYTAMIVLCFMLCQVCWFRCCFKSRKGGDPTDSGVIPHRRKRRRPQNIDQEHRKQEQEEVLQVMVISSQQQEKPKSITKVITLSTESFKGAILVDQKDEQAKDSISKLKQDVESRSDFRIQETVVEESAIKESGKVSAEISAKDSVKVSGKDSAKKSSNESVKKKSKVKSTRSSHLSHPIQGSQVDEALPVDTVILHVASPTSLTGMESASSTVGSSVEPKSPVGPQSPIGPIEQSPPINFPITSTGRTLLSPITSPNAPPLVHSPNTESLRRVVETSRRHVERNVREMSSEVPAIVLEPYVHELGAEMVRQGMPKRMPETMVVGGGAKVKPLDSSSESSESSLYNYM